MGLPVEAAGRCGAQGQTQDTRYAGVYSRLLQLPGTDRLHSRPLHKVGAAGHIQVAPGPECRNPVVERAPVGDYHAVKPPLRPQDAVKQGAAVAAMDAVELIVGTHNRAGLGLLHRHLKGGEVDLPQRPRVNPAVAILTLEFLAVGGKVLQAGGYPRPLLPLYKGGGQPAGQEGVL